MMLQLLTLLHFAALLGLCLYGLHRLWLIRCLLTPERGEVSPRQLMLFPKRSLW